MFDLQTIIKRNAEWEERRQIRLSREAQERIAAVVLSAGGNEQTYREALEAVSED